MKSLLSILIVTLIFSSCQKDNDSYYRWQITDLNYKWELTDILALNDDTIYVLSYLDSTYQNSVLFQSNDAGKTWTKNSFPKIDDGGLRSIFCLNSSIVFTGGVHGIYQSNDGGINWQKIGLNGQQVMSGEIYFIDKKNGIIANTNTIFKTTDGGNSFIKVYDTAATMSFTQIQFLNEQVGYAVGGASYDSYNFGIMVKTTDGGNTWNPVPKPFKSIIGMSFVSPDIGYVVVSLFESDIAGINSKEGVILLKTTDGGNTWISINDKLWEKYNITPAPFFIDEQNGFLCGYKILSTSDGGKIWKEEFVGDSNTSPIKLAITKSKTVYALCLNRFLLKRSINP